MNPEKLLWKASYTFFDRLIQRARILFDIGRRVAGTLHGYLILDFNAMRALVCLRTRKTVITPVIATKYASPLEVEAISLKNDTKVASPRLAF